MLLPFISYFCLATSFVFGDEANQLLYQDPSQLRLLNIVPPPIQMYNRDHMGIEKILAVNPIQGYKLQNQRNILTNAQNPDIIQLRNQNIQNVANDVSQSTKSAIDPAKLQHLLITIRNFLERQKALGREEDKPKASISLHYDIPVSHSCSHSSKVLDFIYNAYKQITRYCKLTSECNADVLSNINSVYDLVSKTPDGHEKMLENRESPDNLSNHGHNLDYTSSLVGTGDANDLNVEEAKNDIRNFLYNYGKKTVISQTQNSQNSYVMDPTNDNREKLYTNQQILNLLMHNHKATLPVVTKNEKTLDSNALENILLALKGQAGNINQEYAKNIADKLYNVLLQKSKNVNANAQENLNQENISKYPSTQDNILPIKEEPQTPVQNYKNVPVLSTATAEIKVNPNNIIKPGATIKDTFYLSNPITLNNGNLISPQISNSITDNKLSVQRQKIFSNAAANLDISSDQNLYNTYGIYQQLLNSNNNLNLENSEPLNILASQNAYVMPNNIIDSKSENIVQSADLSRLLGVPNLVKLNSVPQHKGLVELTYMIKQPKPTYEPLHYVKYRMPYQQFYYNLQNILTQKPHLRSIPRQLHEELLNGSNVAEATGNLKGLSNDEIIKLISNNGSLVTAKVIENNDVAADEQLKIIQGINANLSFVNIVNSNASDSQRLEAIERLVNSTKSNILGGYLRSYNPVTTYNQRTLVSKEYNSNYPYNTQQVANLQADAYSPEIANSQPSSYYNAYRANPIYYSTVYGAPAYRTLYKNVVVPVKVPTAYYPQNYNYLQTPNTYLKTG